MNASPLIIFGKLNKISLLRKIYGTLEISEEVYQEVVINGIKKKARDALAVKDHIDNKDIQVIKLPPQYMLIAQKIQEVFSIDIGEAETIALAKQLNKKEAIIDEASAREAAKASGIKPIGSLRVLFIAYQQKLISEAEIKEIVAEMENSKYRYSPQVLIEFWKLFETIKK